MIIESAYEKASQLLSENIDKVKDVAERLLVKEKISGAEFRAIMEGKEFIEAQEIASDEQHPSSDSGSDGIVTNDSGDNREFF